jgi:ubiquinone/menaquinone biosynthesis C-methylase UbiE
LAAITITRRVMDVEEDSADIQEKGGRNCTMVSCENHPAVRSRAPGSAQALGDDADSEAARAFDERRFSGPLGRMVAAEQMRVLANMIGRIHERRILDIGTGTGRVAAMLAGGGAHVTAIDTSERMLDAARRRASAQLVDVTFLRADVHALDFESRSFDVVVCLGLLMGARDWRRCLAESCRIADRLVIFDYPSATSVALIHSAIRRTFRARPYRVLTRSAVVDALAQSRFRARSTHRQFMLPLWFHRGLRSRRFSARIEGAFDRAGLRRRFGTPVTICAERM